MALLELVGGFIYLLMGGDLLVRGAVALTRRWDLSPLLVGVTVVALGTSAPELFVSVEAALSEHPGIAVGNVVGSNIANILLVVGTLAMLAPVPCDRRRLGPDTLAMLAAGLALVGVAFDGDVARAEGGLLLLGLCAFLGAKVRQALRGKVPAGVSPGDIEWTLGLPSRPWMVFLFLLIGVIWLPLGARLLVEGASLIAAEFGIPEAIIGLTIVALGTSLPELATSFVAFRRGELDVAIGNVLGSNVLNIAAILGAAAVVAPGGLSVDPHVLRLDVPVMMGAMVLVAVLVYRGARPGRTVGAALVGAYLAYVAVLYATA